MSPEGTGEKIQAYWQGSCLLKGQRLRSFSVVIIVVSLFVWGTTPSSAQELLWLYALAPWLFILSILI